MTQREIIVIGAGMVGASTALELRLRGHAVTLIDRRDPGLETSYGNAGVIQAEAVEPYAFPRDWVTLFGAALGRRLDIRYQVTGLFSGLPQLARYWWNSAPERHRRISRQYAWLIAGATREHQRFISLANAEDLIQRKGLRLLYRSDKILDAALVNAERLHTEYGISFAALDSAALAAAEPGLHKRLAGALHWLESWSVSAPGTLVERYVQHFQHMGGSLLRGDADSLIQNVDDTWQVATEAGQLQSRQVVIALGPWAGRCIRSLGYRMPLFVKRGYHQHFSGGSSLNLPSIDAEMGYVLAPQVRGMRLTTGAEIARIGAPPRLQQLRGAEIAARELLSLGQPVEATPWLGYRPCSADMKPVIGPAPRHKGLWFNFGHGHQGFTLGPVSATLLADLMEGIAPNANVLAFAPSRF
jgi:D-amino-acid dehydrogenase